MSWKASLEEIRDRDWSTASAADRDEKSEEVIVMCSYAAAVSAVVPIPLADLAVVLPVQSVMVMTIGHLHGRTVGETEAKRIVLELGAVAGVAFAGHAAMSALKRLLLPAVGGLLSVSATFALTWGLGHVSRAYFSDPHLSRDALADLFKQAVAEGKEAFSKEAFERFRRDQQASREAPQEAAEAPEPSTPPEPPPEVDEALRLPKRKL